MPEGAELKPITEAAQELGVSRMTIYRWIERGQLTPYVRSAGRKRAFIDMRQARRLLEPRPPKGARRRDVGR